MFKRLALITMSSAICLMLLLVVFGCATTSAYEKKIATWVGEDVNRLVQVWGPPSSTYVLPNGEGTMYTWMFNGGTVATGNYNYYLDTTTYSAQTYWCKTTFTVNKSNVVTSWRWEGNACRSY